MDVQAIRAGLRQARAEARITFLTPSFLATVISPIVMVLAVNYFVDGVEFDAAIHDAAAFSIAGLIGAVGAIAAFNVMSEMQTERTAGTLLRLRMLPYGTSSWVIGKLVDSFIYLIFTGGLTVVAAMLVIPGLRPDSVSTFILAIGLLIASFIVFFPFGVIVGALVRSTWGFIVSMGIFMVLYAGSGTVIPLSLYPEWLQWVVGVMPIYWTAHLGRWVFLPSEAGVGELAESFNPGIGVIVLAVWAIVGFALVPRVLRSGMSRETMGSLMASRERVATKGYA